MSERKKSRLPIDVDAGATLTAKNVSMDFVDWRKGRDRYAVWAIAVDVPALDMMSARLRFVLNDALNDILLPDYARQPHITLGICGFPAAAKTHDDDYVAAAFRSQRQSLAEASIEPFSIEIGAPCTFLSAPYFSVRDDQGRIARLRQALGCDGPGERGFQFVPHVTFGLYGREVPLAPLLRRMRAEHLPSIAVPVDRISLMTYDAAVISGPLASIGEFDLTKRTFRVLDERAMAVLIR